MKKFDTPIKYLHEKLDVKKPLRPIPSIMLGFGDSSNQNNVTPSDPLYYNTVFKKARKDLKKKNAFLSGTRFIVKIIAITKNFYWYEDSECTHTDWKRRRRFPL